MGQKTLYNTFGVRRLLRPVNRDVANKGVVMALKDLVDSHSSGLDINMQKRTKEALQEGSALLICNHPAQVDVLLLLAGIPPREDVYLIAIHGILSILPAIDKHLIPVYIGHRTNMKSDWKYRLLNKYHQIPEYSPDVSHKKNLKSIDLAARRIDEGGLVGIFPTGGSKNKRDFSPGVGYIVKYLEHPGETSVVMAHVSGTSTWDFLRIIPLFNKLFPKLKISFSEPYCANDFVSDSGRHIALDLQRTYENWEKSLKSPTKLELALGYMRFVAAFLFSKLSKITAVII